MSSCWSDGSGSLGSDNERTLKVTRRPFTLNAHCKPASQIGVYLAVDGGGRILSCL